MTGLTTVALAVAPSQPSQPGDPGGQGQDFGKSSPVGLLVLIVFFVAVAFLVRSMTKHLRRVPASFDPPAAASDDAATSDDAAAPTPPVVPPAGTTGPNHTATPPGGDPKD